MHLCAAQAVRVVAPGGSGGLLADGGGNLLAAGLEPIAVGVDLDAAASAVHRGTAGSVLPGLVVSEGSAVRVDVVVVGSEEGGAVPDLLVPGGFSYESVLFVGGDGDVVTALVQAADLGNGPGELIVDQLVAGLGRGQVSPARVAVGGHLGDQECGYSSDSEGDAHDDQMLLMMMRK
ncbi:hypothetical protein PMAYCL1PPCAC_27366, partial [Pristionchus mayeri]